MNAAQREKAHNLKGRSEPCLILSVLIWSTKRATGTGKTGPMYESLLFVHGFSFSGYHTMGFTLWHFIQMCSTLLSFGLLPHVLSMSPR